MWRRQTGRGFSLIEVIIASALVAAGVMVLLTLIPSGVLSLKKAEDLQTATAYGLEVMEISRGGFERSSALDDFHITLNSTEFHVTRQFWPVADTDNRLFDVQVSVSWNGQPVPVQLSTRMPQPASP